MRSHTRLISVGIIALLLASSLFIFIPQEEATALDSGAEPVETLASTPNVNLTDIYWGFDDNYAIVAGEGVAYYYAADQDVWANLSYNLQSDDYVNDIAFMPNWGYSLGTDPGAGGSSIYFAGGDTQGFEALQYNPFNDVKGIQNGLTDSFVWNDTTLMLTMRGARKWQDIEPMPTTRVGHTMSQLSNNKALVFGGATGGVTTNAYTRYDGNHERWDANGNAPVQGVAWHTATKRFGGEIIVIGGWNSSTGPRDQALAFDDNGNFVTTLTNAPTPLFNHTATLLNNDTILIVGGYVPGAITNQSWIFNASAGGQWFAVKPIPSTGRVYHDAVKLDNGNVLITGGLLHPGTATTNETWIYNASSQNWDASPPLLEQRYGHSSAILATNDVVVMGGHNGTAIINTSEKLNYEEPTVWYSEDPIQQARGYMKTAFIPDGRVLLIGGVTALNTGSRKTDSISGDNGQEIVDDLRFPRREHAAVTLEDGRILTAGGSIGLGGELATAEIYDYGWGKWFDVLGLNSSDQVIDVVFATQHYAQIIATKRDGNSYLYTANDEAPYAREALMIPGENATDIFYNNVENILVVICESGNAYNVDLSTFTTGNAWMEIPFSGTIRPSARSRHSFALSNSVGAGILFGGTDDNGGFYDDTWLVYPEGGYTWFNVSGTNGPSPRAGAAISYSPVTNIAYLFGGFDGTQKSDTWSFNFTTMTWSELSPSTIPMQRYGAKMVFDPNTEHIYMYGGMGPVNPLSDMYEFNTTTENWGLLNGANKPSFGRTDHSMTYDDVLDRIILFGGEDIASNPLNDVWFYDSQTGAQGTWFDMTTGSEPSARYGTAIIQADDDGNLILVGGRNATETFDDAYLYNTTSNSWIQITAENSPGPRAFHALMGGGDVIFAIGGDSNGGFPSGTINRHDYLVNISMPELTLGSQIYSLPDWSTINDGRWNTEGDTLLLVGNGGALYSYTPGHTLFANVTDLSVHTGDLLGVTYKPPSSPGFFATVGSGGGFVLYNEIQTTSEITTDVYWPHLNGLDLLTTHTPGGEGDDASAMNGKVDVDSGLGTTTYWLKLNVSDLDGLATLDTLDLYMWFDYGATGTSSNYPAGNSNNTQVHFQMDISGAGGWSIIDDSGNGEFTIVGEDTVALNATNSIEYVQFIMGPQIRYSNGTHTDTYGDQASDQSDKTGTLNDSWTWDIHANLTDTVGAYANAYDEFGVYRYTSLGTSGLPGDQSGGGPPNIPIALSPVGNITFSSNCEYRLNVSVTDLTGFSVPTNIIPATVLAIKGGDLSGIGYQSTSNFSAANAPQTLLGTATGWALPNAQMNTTNTSSVDAGTAIGTVTWVCHTPNVPEDRYIGTARFTIIHE